MVALEEFSRIVDSIYAAAAPPGDWTTPLSELRRAVGAAAVTLSNAGEEIRSGPVGVVRALGDTLSVRLTAAIEPICLLVTAPTRSAAFAKPPPIEIVSALVPHWQRALHLHDQISGTEHAATEVAEVIDAMSNAVIMIGRDRSIVHLNAAAQRALTANDGLRVSTAGVHAARPSTDAQLQLGVARAVRGADRGATTMTCTRPSGAWPYVVHVAPLGSERALMVVVDPGEKPGPATALVRHIFGMTGSEAEVAVRILNGDGLRPISQELSLSMATVKTHLQHVFDKTATHRQAELVRLLLSIVP